MAKMNAITSNEDDGKVYKKQSDGSFTEIAFGGYIPDYDNSPTVLWSKTSTDKLRIPGTNAVNTVFQQTIINSGWIYFSYLMDPLAVGQRVQGSVSVNNRQISQTETDIANYTGYSQGFFVNKNDTVTISFYTNQDTSFYYINLVLFGLRPLIL